MHRHHNGGNVMECACFLHHWKSELVFEEGHMDSSRYFWVLDTTLLPFIENYHPPGAVFQQDNAREHSSACTKQWFWDMNVRVLDWPSRSPDANFIENHWGILSLKGYNRGRQFDTVDDLRGFDYGLG